jgi:transcriptional regulator with XRE-family HTH domain
MKTKQPKYINPKKSTTVALIAKNVKYYRLQKDISQEYLAELANVHRNQIGLIERAEANSLIINIENIAHALGVKVVDLLHDPPHNIEK